MKFLFPIIFLFGTLLADPIQDDLEVMQELIETTQKNLDEQKIVLQKIYAFQEARLFFIEEPTNAKLAFHLVEKSIALQKEIEKGYLNHLFSKDLLEEVAFFSQAGKQQRPS